MGTRMEDSGIDSDPKVPISFGGKVTYEDNGSDSSNSSFNNRDVSVAKQLQRKLEQKLQDNKKLQPGQPQQQGDYKKLNNGSNLIPIQRLPIPSKEQLPLVEWDSNESEEEVHFFPVSKANVKSELTDTFSIEEMDISNDEDDDLNLLPPKPTYARFKCCSFSMKCSII